MRQKTASLFMNFFGSGDGSKEEKDPGSVRGTKLRILKYVNYGLFCMFL